MVTIPMKILTPILLLSLSLSAFGQSYFYGSSPCAAPSISGQPTSVTNLTNTINTFTVTAAGQGLTYQWRTNTANLSNVSPWSGVTTATLTGTSVPVGTNNVDVVVTGSCGSITSSVAVLAITNGAGGGGGANPIYKWIATAGVNQSGGNVSGWTDQVSQVVAPFVVTMPGYFTSIQNGLPGLQFGGTSRLAAALTNSMATSTVLVACRVSGGAGQFEFLFDDTNAASRVAIYKDSGTPWKWTAFAGTGLSETGTSLLSTNYIVGVKFNGASSVIWKNGASASAVGNAGANNLVDLNIGNNNADTLAWENYIFEIRIYATVLSDADLLTAFTQMDSTWAIY